MIKHILFLATLEQDIERAEVLSRAEKRRKSKARDETISKYKKIEQEMKPLKDSISIPRIKPS